jgi:hypothetical protein
MSGKYGIPEGRLKIWLRRQEGQLYKYVPLMGKTFAVSSCLKTNNSIPKQ